jgi:hypothetical protein
VRGVRRPDASATIDDAEADKTAKLLDGAGIPAVRRAAKGRPRHIDLPRPMLGRKRTSRSRSRRRCATAPRNSLRSTPTVADLCAAFELPSPTWSSTA